MEAFPPFVGRDTIWIPDPNWRESLIQLPLRRPKIGSLSIKTEKQLFATPKSTVTEVRPRVRPTKPLSVLTERKSRTENQPVASITGYRIRKKQPETGLRSVSPRSYYKIGKSPLELEDQPLVPTVTYKLGNVNLHIPAHVPHQMRKYQYPVDEGRYLLRWDAAGRLVSLTFEANKNENKYPMNHKLSTPSQVKEELRKRRRPYSPYRHSRSPNNTSSTSTAAGTSAGSGHYEVATRSERNYKAAESLIDIIREFFPSNEQLYGNDTKQSRKRKR